MFIFPFFMMNSHTQKEKDTFHNLCGFHVARYQFFRCFRMVYVLSLLFRKMLEVGAFLVQPHRFSVQSTHSKGFHGPCRASSVEG